MPFFSLTFPKVCIFCFENDQIPRYSNFLIVFLKHQSEMSIEICTSYSQINSPAACILQDFKIALSLTNFIIDLKKDLVRLKRLFQFVQQQNPQSKWNKLFNGVQYLWNKTVNVHNANLKNHWAYFLVRLYL